MLDDYINVPQNLYTRDSETVTKKHKKHHYHHHHKKNKKKSKKNKKDKKNKKENEQDHIIITGNHALSSIENKSSNTLSIDTNIVKSTNGIISDSEESHYYSAVPNDKLLSTTKTAASPTIVIKLSPTSFRHDTKYTRMSILTATPINTVFSSRFITSQKPTATPSAPLDTSFHINNSNPDEYTSGLHTGKHKLALGLGIGFGCLAIIGLVALLIQNYKRKLKINHHSPNDVGNFFSEKPKSLPSSNDISTRWRPSSLLGVVASVVARLPASRSSGSVVGMGSDITEQESFKNAATLNPSYLRNTYLDDAI